MTLIAGLVAWFAKCLILAAGWVSATLHQGKFSCLGRARDTQRVAGWSAFRFRDHVLF